jgi:DegV family protein with EDD domain
MNKIALVTDTDASLPAHIAAKYSIQQVPITVHFDTEVFTTGVDIDDRQVFEKIDQRNKLPTTSAPSPGAFQKVFQAAFDNGAETILCINVSSKVSATYNAAISAREMFPGRDITVMDSLNLTMGQGFMVLAAAEAIEKGATKAEAVQMAEYAGQRVHTYAVLSTLKYLALSGRVGKLAAGMADTLNIKPLLTVRDGKLDLLEKVRTRKKAIERMLDLVKADVSGKSVERVAVIHVTDPEGASQLQEELRSAMPCPREIITAEFSAGLSVHAGKGVVGLVVQTS